MDSTYAIKQTKSYIELINKVQNLLKGSELDANQLLALQKINALESFLVGDMRWHESYIEFEKRKKELQKSLEKNNNVK